MTTEPAGAGTAMDIARRIVAEILGGADPATVDGPMVALVASAITASRRQAKEEDAKIAETEASPTPIVAPLTNAAYDEAARTIAAAIRSSINPPGEKE